MLIFFIYILFSIFNGIKISFLFCNPDKIVYNKGLFLLFPFSIIFNSLIILSLFKLLLVWPTSDCKTFDENVYPLKIKCSIRKI